jgi:hypothetical protein
MLTESFDISSKLTEKQIKTENRNEAVSLKVAENPRLTADSLFHGL